jgi:3-hydroxyacyl-CoA dehydrogenase
VSTHVSEGARDAAAAIQRVAVVGTGVIGASWAALFLARGLKVSACDPAPNAEAALHRQLAAHWSVLRPDAPDDVWRRDLRFSARLEDAVADADFVQENGPERLDVKRALYAELDAASPEAAVLATSSSTLLVSDVQAGCPRFPQRVVLGHPFNPPHLIPLVEVVGGKATSDLAIETAVAFYARIGRKPVRLKREIFGHIANRLQAALWQEAFHLLQEGIASVADLDTAIAHGPGLRWALLGPFLNLHLSGGAGGMRHTLAHLGAPTEAMWRALGKVTLTEELKATIIAGVKQELSFIDQGELVAARDAVLLELLLSKEAAKALP